MVINRSKILLFLIVGILCLGFKTGQKPGDPIALRDEKLNFTPREFYIADVIDERANKNSVASIVYKDEAQSYVTRLADLKNGAANAIKLFVLGNLHQDKKLRQIVITLKEFKLTENSIHGGKVNGHLAMNISFGMQKDYGVLQLVNYTGGVRYTRLDIQTNMAETILSQGITEALSWFNTWINKYADSDPRLAKSVQVSFSDYTEKPEGDTIYYSSKRPLSWADFKDKPRASNFEAEIFASVGYTEHVSVEKGIIKLDIAVKVNMPKSGSWVRGGSLDDYALNHEQRHFDIAKIVGEHFKQKIAGMELPPDNYDGFINVEYLETLRELTRMQTQYDRETHHGADRAAQATWNAKIDKELKGLGFK